MTVSWWAVMWAGVCGSCGFFAAIAVFGFLFLMVMMIDTDVAQRLFWRHFEWLNQELE